MFGPVFERASERHADAVFGKVDTEAQPTLADALGHLLDPDADGDSGWRRPLRPARGAAGHPRWSS